MSDDDIVDCDRQSTIVAIKKEPAWDERGVPTSTLALEAETGSVHSMPAAPTPEEEATLVRASPAASVPEEGLVSPTPDEGKGFDGSPSPPLVADLHLQFELLKSALRDRSDLSDSVENRKAYDLCRLFTQREILAGDICEEIVLKAYQPLADGLPAFLDLVA
ncbi:hypothetical protein HK097_004452 [Rhizophlyctis rosea]|uniref:Uncharacterized protein n=1 Tax=Rhizophlyctis rosea TaxID=64517 RepID=A0AAD5X6G4_9FUNG|nr:hypothetical protein HK097_004452 [Rhizophlyctis rosea]